MRTATRYSKAMHAGCFRGSTPDSCGKAPSRNNSRRLDPVRACAYSMRMDPTHKLSRNAGDQATRRPQKQAVNLSISRELLNRARSGDLNLSNILEVALEQKLEQQ